MSWLRTLFARPVKEVISSRSFDLMCLTMAVVLAVHAPHLPWWLTAALALVLGLRWWQRRRRGGKAPLLLKLPLIALLTLAIIFSYGTIFGRAPGSALAVGLLVFKLLESETPRDARVGMAVACFVLMAALLFDQGLMGTLLVMLGLLPALAALRSLEPAQQPASLPRQLLPGLVLLGVSLPLTLFAFVLIPRLDSPLWGTSQRDQATTGLSDEMSPGNMTDLLTDDSPAMRVGFDQPGARPRPSQQYFRAFVMWRFDGRTWNAGRGESGQPPEPVQGGDAIGYTITLQPSHRHVLPALDVPLTVPPDASMEPGHTLRRTQSIDKVIRYRAQSTLRYRLQPRLNAGDRRRGLLLPAGFNPRTLALGRQWRARYGHDDPAIVQAALAMFHNGGFSYTLAAPPLGRDSVDDFLFSTRSGFCEHYASSFTIAMRAAGIPARVVTGYQGGYWNAMGDYLLVRQSDAHAWSEVWLKGRGWVRVDPTAAVRPERVDLGAAAAAGSTQLPWYQNVWLQGIRNHWDIVNRYWNQGVVGFDSLRQRGLLTPFGAGRLDPRTLGLLLVGGGALFGVAGLLWAMRRREPMNPAVAGLRILETKLARAGLARRHHEGPQHYLSRAARALPTKRSQLELLMHNYLQLRYGQLDPPAESMRAFRRAAREFKARGAVKSMISDDRRSP